MASHMPGVPPQGLCTDSTYYQEGSSSDCMAHSLTSSKSLFKCHLLSKASPDLSIQFGPVLAGIPPDPDPSFHVAPSADGTKHITGLLSISLF